MSKILMLANDESTIYNFRREIISSFVKEGNEVYVSYPLGNHTEEIKALGASVIPSAVERHGTSILGDIKYFFSCIKLISDLHPDVVLTYTVKPNIYGSMAARVKKVPYMNNITGLGSILKSGGIMAKLICFLQKLAYRKSSCIFFQNESNYNELVLKKVVGKKIKHRILPGSGVNLSLHKFEPYPDENTITKFVIVSRVRQDKGFDEFFKTAKNIKAKNKDTEFHIVGWYEDEHYRQIIEKLQADKTIIYHGKKNPNQVHEILKESHCLIHPSYHEGMANVVLEAAASGRPVLASDIPGCREGFDEGITGFGFESENAKALENTVEKFLSLPYLKRKEMGEKARIKMENEFDRKFVAEAYLEEISKLEEKNEL